MGQGLIRPLRADEIECRIGNVIGCYEKSIGGETIWRKDVYTTQQPK